MLKTGISNRVGNFNFIKMIRLLSITFFALCLSFSASAADTEVPAEEFASPCVAYAIGYADGANDVHNNLTGYELSNAVYNAVFQNAFARCERGETSVKSEK